MPLDMSLKMYIYTCTMEVVGNSPFDRGRKEQPALLETAGCKRTRPVICDVICYRSSAFVCLRTLLGSVRKGLSAPGKLAPNLNEDQLCAEALVSALVQVRCIRVPQIGGQVCQSAWAEGNHWHDVHPGGHALDRRGHCAKPLFSGDRICTIPLS